jgi:hypothetical protein
VSTRFRDIMDISIDNIVPSLELKKLLHELQDHGRDTCIRFRMIGEMWMPNFLRIVKLTDREVILSDETTLEFIFIRDVRNVIQFEIDNPFHEFQPHNHYRVEQ